MEVACKRSSASRCAKSRAFLRRTYALFCSLDLKIKKPSLSSLRQGPRLHSLRVWNAPVHLPSRRGCVRGGGLHLTQTAPQAQEAASCCRLSKKKFETKNQFRSTSVPKGTFIPAVKRERSGPQCVVTCHYKSSTSSSRAAAASTGDFQKSSATDTSLGAHCHVVSKNETAFV